MSAVKQNLSTHWRRIERNLCKRVKQGQGTSGAHLYLDDTTRNNAVRHYRQHAGGSTPVEKMLIVCTNAGLVHLKYQVHPIVKAIARHRRKHASSANGDFAQGQQWRCSQERQWDNPQQGLWYSRYTPCILAVVIEASHSEVLLWYCAPLYGNGNRKVVPRLLILGFSTIGRTTSCLFCKYPRKIPPVKKNYHTCLCLFGMFYLQGGHQPR